MTGTGCVLGLFGDGTDGTYDRVEYKYNRLGHVIWTKDQNETVHEYAFDGVGRQTADMATLPQGSAIDDSVLRIEHGYEVRGMVASITSFDAFSGGNAVDQILREYGDFGLLDKEYQEHAGEVDANTLYVQYNHADASAGLRLESVRYPNGRLVHYTYGTAGSDADHLNRLDAIRDDDGGQPGDVLAQYTYLGLGMVVVEDYVQPQVKLDLWGGTSGEYQGFDRFGRVVDHLWRDYGASADADRFLYGYDRAGNRIWKENDVSANLGTPLHLDELYQYDGVSQLIDLQRGNLGVNRDAITDKVFAEDWNLDATGNWSDVRRDDDGNGTWDLDEQREHNAANEIVEVEGSAGNVAHDAVGNMTRVPKPGDAAAYYDLAYDAWNRLVSVVQDDGQGGDEPVAEYEYTGDNRRVVKHTYAAGTLDETRHFYYTREWQCVEERTEAGGVLAADADMQYVWGTQYIDALILRDRDTTADGTLDERLYALQDANWNVTALAETDGDIIERYTYTAYGTVEVRDADFVATAAASAFAWQYTYTTRRLDEETGLMHYRNRMYHTELGRFVSRDPVGYEGGDVSLYRYVASNPKMRVDPLGEEWYDYTGVGPLIQIPYYWYQMYKYSEDDEYEVEERADGSTQVIINGKCIIVILYGDGNRKKPHDFWFRAPCTAGGFVGCDAGSTNNLILEDNRLPGSKMTNGLIYTGLDTTRGQDKEKTKYWNNRLKEGARDTAEKFCRDENGCCDEVTIYYVETFGASHAQPSPHRAVWNNYETISCAE